MAAARPARLVSLLLAAALAAPAAAGAERWRVDLERSSFAVVTARAGVAARLAHDHLVVARGPRCELDFDPADPTATRLSCVQPVLALDADPAAERARLAPRLEVLGVRSGELPPVDDDDRAEIRAAMLAADQLFADRFPELRAELVSLVRRGGGDGARVALGWDARIRVKLRGETVETTAPARFEVDGDTLTAELVAQLRFTDFRIEPYSGVLGTVRVADPFHLYVELVAARELVAP
jgi:hypothetical protein